MKIRLLLAFLLISTAVFAWMDPLPFPQGNWQYRAPITVSNNASALADYQVAINTTNLVYNNTGLVGSWHFSESAGTRFADSSGNGNDGTYSGETFNTGTLTNFALNASSGWVDGKYGKALVFDGADDFVNVGSLGIGGANTREFWFKPNNVAGNTNQYFMDLGGNSYWVQLYDVDSDGKLEIRAGGASSTYVNGVREFTNTSEWHHVAVTVSAGGTLSIYVDGTLDASGGVTVGTPGALYLGRYSGAGSYYFNGIMDNVRIYNRALSASEINQTYQNNTFIRSGLVGYWRFDEGAGTTAYDTHHIVAPDNRNGTKFGNALSFDGVGDYVSVPSSTNLNPTSAISVEAWFDAKNITSQQVAPAIVKKSDASAGYAFEINSADSKLRFWVYVGGAGWISSPPSSALSTNSWYHAVGTFDGSFLRLYINGAEIAGATSQAGTIVAASNPLNIGRSPSETNRLFNGTIDEVRVYNRSLSAQEIQAHYNASKLRPDYQDLRFSQPYAVYETPIAVSGTGTSLTDYQVLVNITNITILSHVKADGSDLRFFAAQTSSPYSQTGLPYWIEGINSTQAKVWVKANVSSSGSIVYIYYGNISATAASNKSAVMLAAEDDAVHQTTGTGTVTNIPNGHSLVPANNGAADVYYPIILPAQYVTQYDTRPYGTFNGQGAASAYVTNSSPPTNTGENFYPSVVAFVKFQQAASTRYLTVGYISTTGVENCWSGSAWTTSCWPPPALTFYDINYSAMMGRNSTHYFWKVWNASGTVQETSVDALLVKASANYYYVQGTPATTNYWGNGNTTNTILRKYASVEPVATLGSESVKSLGNEALLNYWQESDSRVWVKAASVPAGASTLYAYYGNPNATGAGNGDSTFLFFDDFLGSSLDPAKWTSGSFQSTAYGTGSVTVSNSIATLTGGTNTWWGMFANGAAFSTPPLTVEFLYKGENGPKAGVETSGTINPAPRDEAGFWYDSTGYGSCNNNVCNSEGITPPISSYSLLRMDVYGGGIRYFVNRSLAYTKTTNVPDEGLKAYMAAAQPSGKAYADWVFIRKYASPEPTLSLQQEELQSPALFIGISPAGKTTYPSYNETFSLWVKNNQTASDTFTLSCAGTCSVSPPSLYLTPYQNGSATVTITSANVLGTTQYTITATSQANASNFASVSASLTVDTTKWRDNWTDAYNRDFKYRVPITISNGGSALADYQVNMTIDTYTPIGLARMRGDCGDIRITNGTNEMPYWVESGCNTTSTRIWARVPYVPAGNSTVYAYYGSSLVAGASNGTATFLNFDDAETGTLTGKWFQDAGTSTSYSADRSYYGNKSIKVDTSSAAQFIRMPLSPVASIVEFEFYDDNDQSEFVDLQTRRSGPLDLSGVAIDTNQKTSYYIGLNGPGWVKPDNVARSVGWHKVKLMMTGATTSAYIDGVALVNAYPDANLPIDFIAQTVTTLSRYSIFYFDDFRVRKSAPTEPSASAGSEQARGYRVLVRRCGLKQTGANVSAYYPANSTYANSCLTNSTGICTLEISAGTYNLLLNYSDNSISWKNGTIFS